MLDELWRRSLLTVGEPGRRVIAKGVDPITDLKGFIQEAEKLAVTDLQEAPPDALCFFDRGLLDALAAKERMGGPTLENSLGRGRPYRQSIFFADCWREIFTQDEGRQHSFDTARAESEHLKRRLPQLGYKLIYLPKAETEERANFVLRELGLG
ncbi:AAA family ATPase [Qipengyuania gelatinilytica]|uniref:AAA family ATPase n=1 Tax=Qipengyuania gelatinilytica TaxID=2867231 RepID=A0ABX8ZY77_9SPHN|nr:AAA family ATPase [Qipengyuania gelatinilytica]